MKTPKDLDVMYSEVERVNDLLCLPSDCWSEEERRLVERHWNMSQNPIATGAGVGGNYYYPNREDLEEEECEHDYVTKYLLTTAFKVCNKCDKEE